MMPNHKSDLVDRFGKGKTVLAIGDGNNDVPMIKSANVGIGLLGKEGH